jgi:NADH:ubiquinone oxidoreductase subunit F (NADH-binding)/(2Fe-2S) ferredoxin
MKITSLKDLHTIRDNQQKSGLSIDGQTSNEKIKILVGMATCGISSGAGEIRSAFEEAIKQGNLNNVSVVPVGCAGNCFSEPTVQINAPGQVPVIYGGVKVNDIPEILEKHIQGGTLVEHLQLTLPAKDKQVRIALRNCGLINPEDIMEYLAAGGYEALGYALTQMHPEQIINEVTKSGLRGRGGGGFPTGLKWQITQEQPGEKKYIICNADEGDPGAFMDRSILEGDPHSVLEAMAIGGYAIGAEQGIVYIRAEYPLALSRLNTAINQAREWGLLGSNIFGTNFNFDIRIKYGAGAFVCGEETALINSCEGKRGEPNYKPPYPAQKGYWGYPTCVNNVETLANIPPIITRGADWFASIGTEKSKGTKVFALAGKIKNIGLVEVPMGTTLREVIYDIGGGIRDGRNFKAVQTGGPSGGVISSEYLDIPIDYDNLIQIGSMMGSGGMIVMDDTDNMVNIAKFYLEFSMEESCGRCTPCRIGTKRMYEIINKLMKGKGTMDDLYSLKQLTCMVRDSSLCGLGQSAPNPVISTMNHFWSEYLALLPDPRSKIKFNANKFSRKNAD